MPEKRSNDSFDDSGLSSINRKKISIKQTPEEEAKAIEYFQPHVFVPSFKSQLTQNIKDSQPYRWGTIKNLISDELLRNVRKEIMQEIEFTKKETDIYKVFQSGDLANLSAMPADLLARLPSLYKLRSAIYSETFRSFISDVTGAGKLSGIKTDLSIQLYTKGCHLLTHDDVIGSRRVSFILYMPDPDATWKPHYGGALQLLDSLVPNVPRSDIHSKLVPDFNQIAFFTVQPGLSFHAVEEVKTDRQRLSLQGWFHIPQRGEDGFVEGEQEATEQKSTLQQLESKELKEFDFPKLKLTKIPNCLSISKSHDIKFTELDKEYLLKFMNPYLLIDSSITKLSKIFTDESVVDILSFLNEEYESLLKCLIKSLEINEYPSMPKNQAEVESSYPWKLAIPSHKQRYMYIDGGEYEDINSAKTILEINQVKNGSNCSNFDVVAKIFELQKNLMSSNPDYKNAKLENDKVEGVNVVSIKLCELASMFKSKAFRKWLTRITELKLVKDNVLIRRFRPGQDFILATKNTDDEDDDSNGDELMDGLLEGTMSLTPSHGWESGEWGGYELCLVDDDEISHDHDHDDNSTKPDELNEDEAAIYRTADKDSVVYEGQACWNRFTLMYRDPSVMKFVKYVSYEAPGCRWDINCSWKCSDEFDESD
ncbi:hypothetical protein C6P40_002974 [Pichia californica]|uniref:uS12 prolyl 3,4-dihydroxylase n=1 Tax=Pichia californica TaxID=460514 RepID=A0A9P6WH51_9ASCO|nr:hypothetical protein C6P42_002944 [[Candida] californica]KAG0687036.1 hypothetical protein C6P40_002974 [[Candida] californica]